MMKIDIKSQANFLELDILFEILKIIKKT